MGVGKYDQKYINEKGVNWWGLVIEQWSESYQILKKDKGAENEWG